MGRNTPLQNLGLAIKRCRTQAKISQEGLAELADCHRNYVGLLETGKRNPSYLRLAEISKGLGMQLSTLIKMAEEIA